MRRVLGALLMIGGGYWAGMGVWIFMKTWGVVPATDPVAGGTAVLISGLFFVFPGLVVLGIGALVYRRTGSPTLTPPRAMRPVRVLLIAAGLLVAIFAFVHLTMPPTPTSAPTSAVAKVIVPPKMPRLLLTVQQVTYEHGYVKVVGVAKNVGDEGARSPRLKLAVFDSPTGNTLLAESTTWPAGQIGKTMYPDTSAAFQFFALVPGEPSNVRWRITMDDGTPYEVVQPGKKK